jgi:hypothetical protein
MAAATSPFDDIEKLCGELNTTKYFKLDPTKIHEVCVRIRQQIKQYAKTIDGSDALDKLYEGYYLSVAMSMNPDALPEIVETAIEFFQEGIIKTPRKLLAKAITNQNNFLLAMLYIKYNKTITISDLTYIYRDVHGSASALNMHHRNVVNIFQESMIFNSNLCSNQEVLIFALQYNLREFIINFLKNDYNKGRNIMPLLFKHNFDHDKIEHVSDLLLSNGQYYDEESLYETCCRVNRSCCSAKVALLLNNKVIPTEQCFNAMFRPGDRGFYYGNDNLVELFILYGYNFTYENLLSTIAHKIKLNETYFKDMVFDSRIVETCSKYACTYYDLTKVMTPAENLQFKFLTHHIADVKTAIAASGLKPDIVCLRNACKIGNTAIIRLLTDTYKIIPDSYCLQNVLASNCSAPIKTHIANAYFNHIHNPPATKAARPKISSKEKEADAAVEETESKSAETKEKEPKGEEPKEEEPKEEELEQKHDCEMVRDTQGAAQKTRAVVKPTKKRVRRSKFTKYGRANLDISESESSDYNTNFNIDMFAGPVPIGPVPIAAAPIAAAAAAAASED